MWICVLACRSTRWLSFHLYSQQNSKSCKGLDFPYSALTHLSFICSWGFSPHIICSSQKKCILYACKSRMHIKDTNKIRKANQTPAVESIWVVSGRLQWLGRDASVLWGQGLTIPFHVGCLWVLIYLRQGWTQHTLTSQNSWVCVKAHTLSFQESLSACSAFSGVWWGSCEEDWVCRSPG